MEREYPEESKDQSSPVSLPQTGVYGDTDLNPNSQDQEDVHRGTPDDVV